MRYAPLVAFCALATLTAVSTAAADSRNVKKQPGETTNSIPSRETPTITLEEENKIPYRACPNAVGWVNGHLRCKNY
jgi:hypothetical protein